ncbi:MAG: tetratricopeptide repeat protein, partial [Pyrinomonadaceae bacterium]
QRAFDEAKRDYDQAIALNPDLVDAYLNRAASHYAAKDYAAALADYDRVIALAPKHAQAYFNRGATHDALGNAQVAIKDYTRTIELRPDYADAYFNRGLDYLSLGKRDLAVEDFKAVLDLDADPQILTTARAHLEKLDTSAAAVRPTATPRVYLHYGDVRHAPQQLEEISAALARQDYKVFSSKGAERRSGGDVRYFYKADEQAAANVKQIVEGILARQGFPVSLDLRPLSPEDVTDTSNKDTQSGAIEVWLPPLSQRIPIQRNAPNLPARSKELQD